MWITKRTGFRTNRQFIVGPFGANDQALDIARELEANGPVGTAVRPLVEPGPAVAGAGFGAWTRCSHTGWNYSGTPTTVRGHPKQAEHR